MKRVPTARRLRRDMTDAEQRLWARLRNRQLLGLKFRRQMVVEGFIADFGCIEARLIIELDGGQHAETVEADRLRTRAIEGAGFLVLRFWNEDMLRDTDGVIEEIMRALAARPTATTN